MLFQDLGARKVVADFSGGTLSSDGGVPLMRQMDGALGLTRRLADCFEDARNPVFVEHFLPELLAQQIYTEALGYEDLKRDHQHLRHDPLLATACGKADPLGIFLEAENDASVLDANKTHSAARSPMLFLMSVSFTDQSCLWLLQVTSPIGKTSNRRWQAAAAPAIGC